MGVPTRKCQIIETHRVHESDILICCQGRLGACVAQDVAPLDLSFFQFFGESDGVNVEELFNLGNHQYNSGGSK